VSDQNELAKGLRLRPERAPVTRLSRKVLIGLVAASAIVVFGSLIWALYQGEDKTLGGGELYNTENKPAPEGLSTLPHDYAAIPRNGSPVPGDLGRPMLNANQLAPVGPARLNPLEEHLAQEEEAARTSHLFATTNATEQPKLPASSPPSMQVSTASEGKTEPPPTDPDSLQNMQERKLMFLTATVDRKTINPDRLADTPSPFVVQAGTVISAALITGIRSDLPGQVTAQVTENVYDSPTGNYLLIPQGSKLVGAYDSQISFAQDRVLLVWTRLIIPNGHSIVLERQPSADTEGFSGLEDQVDEHWGQLLVGAALSTLLGVGSELGATNSDNAIVQALRQGSSSSLNQTGQQVVRRNLNVQPTITIRPGFPVRVIVNRDLVLSPYRSSD
jgi:type IV secretion system protein TrbI